MFADRRGCELGALQAWHIALILLAASALVGAAAGLRLKALALVPIAFDCCFLSRRASHERFRIRSGIAILIACLILNQATYLVVQVLGSGLASHPHWTT